MTKEAFTLLPGSPGEIMSTVLQQDRRLLLFGPPGIGKSTLCAQLATQLFQAGRACWCISADPGSPAFGIPGVLSLGEWQTDQWRVRTMEALCTLDAGRFRLPLTLAARRLAESAGAGTILIDGPGVVRGMAGKELLHALVEATAADAVLALTHSDKTPPLLQDLQALSVEVWAIEAAAYAARPGKRARARSRSANWDQYLQNGVEQTLDLHQLALMGTPPPPDVETVWSGRQLALLRGTQTLALGEVRQLQGNHLTLALPHNIAAADSVLIRDVQRTADGFLETAEPFITEPLAYLPPADVLPSIEEYTGPRVGGRVGNVDVSLVNGLFADAMLHLRLRHQRRSLLFDLGEGARLPARVAHQITDVFVSHAHMDHFAGFLWLLRSRIGNLPACRIYGPPGLAKHVHGFIQGILWDRVAERGPRFDVFELHDTVLKHFYLQAGRHECVRLGESFPEKGVLLVEPGFRVRATTLDHGTPVLAYALEPNSQINIRKDRLLARSLEPGPWINELKAQMLAGNLSASITLPTGERVPVEQLAADLTLVTPGKKLVYATDFSDSADNRQRVVKLARHAHTFFCEATFVEADAGRAAATQHLTTRACAEIAVQAGVARLVPFHFSRRYADKPEQIYTEIAAICPSVVMPESMQVFDSDESQAVAEVMALD